MKLRAKENIIKICEQQMWVNVDQRRTGCAIATFLALGMNVCWR